MSDSIYRLMTGRSLRFALLATSISVALGAAALAEEPAGPGTVFGSLDAAAADALHYASATKGDSWREWGGAISRVPGGFSYEAPLAGDHDGVRLVLGVDHVAWYYTHSQRDHGPVDLENERISKRDRRMVDRVDPAHRPLFVSTPSGRLVAYRDGRLTALTISAPRLAENGR